MLCRVASACTTSNVALSIWKCAHRLIRCVCDRSTTPVRDRLKGAQPHARGRFPSSERRIDLASSGMRNGEDGTLMQIVQGTSSSKIVTAHAMFLASVSRHFVSLQIEPMLEAVGRSALCVLGDICVVDRVWGAGPTRILEVTASPDAWMEASASLAFVTRGEIRVDGKRSRLTV